VGLRRRRCNEALADETAHCLVKPVDVDPLERVAAGKLALLRGIIKLERVLPQRFSIVEEIIDYEEGRVHRPLLCGDGQKGHAIGA
jgi:hypothetical protein